MLVISSLLVVHFRTGLFLKDPPETSVAFIINDYFQVCTGDNWSDIARSLFPDQEHVDSGVRLWLYFLGLVCIICFLSRACACVCVCLCLFVCKCKPARVYPCLYFCVATCCVRVLYVSVSVPVSVSGCVCVRCARALTGIYLCGCVCARVGVGVGVGVRVWLLMRVQVCIQLVVSCVFVY